MVKGGFRTGVPSPDHPSEISLGFVLVTFSCITRMYILFSAPTTNPRVSKKYPRPQEIYRAWTSTLKLKKNHVFAENRADKDN